MSAETTLQVDSFSAKFFAIQSILGFEDADLENITNHILDIKGSLYNINLYGEANGRDNEILRNLT
jgi:hypothetical protein